MTTVGSAGASAGASLGGSAGCNSYAGSYELRGDSLTIPGPPAATAMACAEDVMGQEQVYLTLLQQVAGFTIDDVEPRLHLLNDKGQAIVLLRSPNP